MFLSIHACITHYPAFQLCWVLCWGLSNWKLHADRKMSDRGLWMWPSLHDTLSHPISLRYSVMWHVCANQQHSYTDDFPTRSCWPHFSKSGDSNLWYPWETGQDLRTSKQITILHANNSYFMSDNLYFVHFNTELLYSAFILPNNVPEYWTD